MQGRFYPDVFSQSNITVVLPEEDEQEYIHDKYLGELVKGVFLPETRDSLSEIAERLTTRQGIQGIILGGTELPLLLREAEHNGIPFLDTTRIHVKRIVA